MATDPASILRNNGTFASDLLQGKIRDVASASAAKQAELGGVDPYVTAAGIVTGKGAASASEVEMDYRTMNPSQLALKYGPDAGASAAIRRSGGISEYSDPRRVAPRSGADIARDLITTVAAAPIQLVGGVGALEAGALGGGARLIGADNLAQSYEELGGNLSRGLGAFTRAVQGTQSESLQNSRRQMDARNQLDQRDNVLYQQQEGDGVIAGINRVRRDGIAALGNLIDSPDVAADTVANAAGSLIGGGVISKTLQTVGRAATSRAGMTLAERAAAGRYLSPAESLALRYGERASMPAAIAAMEAGGAYQQTYEAAYEKLIAQGVSPDEAAQRANDASLEAAAIQGGVTAVTAPFLGGAHFERTPFAVSGFRDALRKAAGETVEEAFQEGSAQYAQNQGIQDNVDPNQSLTEGVGMNAALGAIGGLGSSVAMQAPGVALKTSIEAAKLPFQAAGKVATYLGDRVEARNQRVEQGLADGLIGQAIAAGPEAQAEAQSIIEQAKGKSAEWRDAARGWVDRTVAAAQESETMQSLARTIMEKSGTAREKLQAAAELVRAMASSEQVQDSQTPDGLAGSTVENIKTVVSNARQSDLVQQAAARGQEMMAKGAKVINSGAKSAVAKFRAWQQSGSDPSNTTAEAGLQRDGSMLADLATTAPESIDPDAADQILYHDDQKGFLTASQRQTLRAASELARARQKVGDEAMQLYGMKDSDARKVSEEVLTQTKFAREKGQKPSVVAHLRGIMSAYNAGDTKLAADRLTDLRFFAQHMGNKVGALNDALAGGNTSSRNPVSYKSLTSRRGFTDAENGLYISPTSESSVGIAQQIAVEAGTVAEAFNRLAAAFPDLGVQQVTIPSLDPSLQRPVADVVSDYAARKEAVPTEEVSSEPAETDQVENQGEESSAAQAPEPVEPVASEPVSEPEAQPTEAANESQTNADQSSEPEAMEAASEPDRISYDEDEAVYWTGSKGEMVRAKFLGYVESDSRPGQYASLRIDGKTSVVPVNEISKIPNRLKDAHPNLIGGTDNRIYAANKLSSKRTVVTDAASPAAAAYAAFRGESNFIEVAGPINRSLTPAVGRAYQGYIRTGQKIFNKINEQLQAFADKPQTDMSKAPTWLNGQATNAAVLNEDGTYSYDNNLGENAVLAALQWLMKQNQYVTRLDEKDVRQILRLNQNDYLPETLIDDINDGGAGIQELATSLTREIQRFWGLDARNDVPRNWTIGPAEGMAKELIAAMVDLGLLEVTRVDISDVTKNHNIPDLVRYKLATDDEGNVVAFKGVNDIHQFPSALERLAAQTVEADTYVGTPPATVPDTQLRNDMTENTAQQKASLKIQQETPHQLNIPFLNAIAAMNEDLVLRLFGGGPELETMNQNDLKSVRGKNLTVQQAYQSIQQMVAEAQNVATRDKTDLGDVEIFFAYNHTVVNRAQMLGKDNPQSNKLMREAVLPTWDVVDMTDGALRDAYFMGLAQALGIKVHTQDPAVSIAQVKTKLAGFEVTMKAMESGKYTLDIIDQMKAEGIDSVVAFHAVMDYARYLAAEDPTKFRTAIYFEADGVVNGVTNALAMFSGGDFTEQFLNNMELGGFQVGEQSRTLAQIRKNLPEGKPKDLYEAIGSRATKFVAALRNQYQNDEAVSGQFNAMNAVMNEFLPGISLTADGEIIVDRAAAKNPITITVYGSGANGIAGNLTNAIVKAVYARLSQANALRTADKSLTEAQAFMGGDKATAQARFDQLLKDMSTLMGREILVDEEGGLTVKVRSTAVAQTFGDMTTFTFPPAAVRSLQNNILHGFVTSLVQAIQFTLGHGLFENVAIIRDQVQVWSMLGQYAYALAYQERLAAERKKNPKLTKNDLLSRRQEEQVMKSVMKYLPHFSTGSQNYLFGMSRSSLGNTHFADGMTERMETRAYGYTPSNAGVSGIPGLTIGAGDGQAILNAVSNPDMPKKFLQIFDGIHSTIRDIMTMGKVANEAVFSSWQGDAFGDLTRAFAAMAKGINLDALSTTELEELARTLLPPKQRKKVTHEKIVSAINRLAQTGLDYSEQVSKRRQVLYNVQSSTDQMAGGGAPHQKLGIILSGSAEQKAAAMNRLMNEPGAMETAINEAISFKSASTGLMAKALDKAITKMTPDPATRQLVRELVRSNKVDAYEIHVGTRQELLLKAAEMGINIDPARVNASGFVVPSKKAIFAVDGNMETIVHELIHAATYETLQAHYAGEDIGTAGKPAVDNLEGLMAQFKDAEFEGDAYQAALDEMSRKAEDNDRAGELNEFMAWALANADLASQLSQTKVSPLVRMARNVIQGIKSLLWGGKRSVRVSNDMFTNLRFNTLVVARSQPSTAEMIGDTILYHDPNYGSKTRLTDLNQRIQTKITDQDARNPVDKVTKRNRTNLAGAAAVRVMHAFEDAGFKFTAQDSATFVRVMAIMATSDRLDGNATARMQEIFAHVDKEMKVEDLLDDPNTATVQDYDLATDKLDALLGKHSMAKDAQGRSLILPAFMAAAMVDDSVRAALRKMTQPKTEFAQWNSLDNVLDNLGDIALNNVSRLAAGEKVLKGDQSEVLDELMDTMLDTELESQLYIEKFTNPIGNGVDKLNDTVVNSLDYVAKMAASYAEGVSQKKGAKRLQKTLADGMALLTGIFNKDNGETLAMAAQSNVNSRKLWTPLFELMTEMIGRTTDNAEVYDLIKIARAWVNGIRQQFREQLPKILNSKFSRELTDAEQTHLYKGLGLTDAGLLLDHYSVAKTQQYLSDERVRKAEIDKLITDVMDATEQHALVIKKAEELAKFMVTRKVEASNLLRNANAIAALSGVRGKRGHVSTPALVEAVDKLVSLMAIDELPTGTKTALASLVQGEAKGIGFMLSYLQGQNKIDRAKVDGMTKFNYYKGYMPQEFAQGAQLIVVKDVLSDKESDLSPGAAKLLERGFRRLGAYKGSSWDPYSSKRGVYFASVSGRAPFLQGIAQNVQQTVSGVDAATGFTNSITGGTITDPDAVGDILAGGNGRESGDFLMPVFNENGEVYAFERSVDPALIEHLQPKSHMTNMMGVRSGRQSEETSAHGINRALVRNLRVIYDRDRKAGRENEYVDLSQTKDPVIRDAMSIFSLEMRELIQEEFPDGFMVRKDMINDSIGYRQASIGDAWTGNSRWSPAAQNLVKKSLMGLFGNKAFTYAVQAEQLLQNVIKDVRATIVIRSVIVPMANAASNVYQLMGRGVPVGSILRKVPKKTAEIESWHKSRIRQIEAEAELLAADTDLERNRLKAEIQTIKDGHKRLSIWPLLAAGEFSSVSDAGSREDVMLTQGKLSEYIERAVDKLPPAARTAGKYAIISKDTALFRALQKAVEYGDFVAKAVLYDDLRERKKLSQAEALAQVTEEFVNYDRLPGRDRTYMEGIGLLWFWNFKVRSVKVAASMMKHNPLHSLITMSLPVPISGLGLPIQDNLWASLFDGRLSNSVGYGMAMRAPGLLPTSNLLW